MIICNIHRSDSYLPSSVPVDKEGSSAAVGHLTMTVVNLV